MWFLLIPSIADFNHSFDMEMSLEDVEIERLLDCGV